MKHFTEIHQLIENQQIAIGFVSNLHKYPNVTAQPLFTESMILLYHRCMFETSRNLMDLPPQDENLSDNRWQNMSSGIGVGFQTLT